jgi:hypothetical protein
MTESKLRVNYVKTLWGVTEEMGNTAEGFDALFARIKSEVKTNVRELNCSSPPFNISIISNDGVNHAFLFQGLRWCRDACCTGGR